MPPRTDGWRPLACLAGLLLLAGCASQPDAGVPPEPPRRQLSELSSDADKANPILIYDPIERTNRGLYKLNARVDEAILLPVVDTYQEVTPSFLRRRVSSFFLNLGEVGNFTNAVLQLRPKKAGQTLVRFALNSTIGLLGLFDVASEAGISRQKEDFGQTLGYWGVPEGPYLMLPLLGPSNLRDGVGRVMDSFVLNFDVVPDVVDHSDGYEVAQYGLRPIDVRYRTGFRYHQTGSPFEYQLVRFAYTQARRLQILQ